MRSQFRRVRQYLYIDVQGISDLLAQIGTVVPREHRATRRESDSKTSMSSLGLAAKVWKIGLSGNRSKKATDASAREDQFLVEHPPIESLQQVIEALEGSDQLLPGLRSGDLAMTQHEALPLLFTGSFAFTARHLAAPHEIISAINRNQMVDLELYQDGLRISIWPHIRMGASLRKFVGYNRHGLMPAEDEGVFLRPGSHLARFLQAASVDLIDLGVFGHLSKVANELYIKPYAIWLDAA